VWFLLLSVPNEMRAPAVLGVARKSENTNASAWIKVFTRVVAKHLLLVLRPAAIAVLCALTNRARVPFAGPDEPARLCVL
tara:strand:+ start:462 stop:701 length:240 start_codon:yes stop_codon:yes gene_type:complete